MLGKKNIFTINDNYVHAKLVKCNGNSETKSLYFFKIKNIDQVTRRCSNAHYLGRFGQFISNDLAYLRHENVQIRYINRLLNFVDSLNFLAVYNVSVIRYF